MASLVSPEVNIQNSQSIIHELESGSPLGVYASEIKALISDTYEKVVIFSFQGAFGPPTYGHYTAMMHFAHQVLADYPGYKIVMMFMPTAESSSKKHLGPTQQSRIDVLNVFCELLQREMVDAPIHFLASSLEYHIYNIVRSSATIYTLFTLNKIFPGAIINLGMGLDNAMELPYWQDIDKYMSFAKRIYVVNRQLTPAEKAMTGRFIVNGSTLHFKRSYTYGNEELIGRGFNGRHNPIERDEDGKVITPGQITLAEGSQYMLDLPEVVIIESTVPPTSSSMLRYFIGCVSDKYGIKIASENRIKRKIKKIMFGNSIPPYDPETHLPIPLYDEIVEAVITSYKRIEFPILTEAQRMGFEHEYETFVKTLQSGGKTKKSRSKRRKTRKLKRRSAKK